MVVSSVRKIYHYCYMQPVIRDLAESKRKLQDYTYVKFPPYPTLVCSSLSLNFIDLRKLLNKLN